MDPTDIISLTVGALGIGGALASIYLRATIATTIIDKLDARYVSTRVCRAEHDNVDNSLQDLRHRAEQLEGKMDHGFELIRTLLTLAQSSRDRIARGPEISDIRD